MMCTFLIFQSKLTAVSNSKIEMAGRRVAMRIYISYNDADLGTTPSVFIMEYTSLNVFHCTFGFVRIVTLE